MTSTTAPVSLTHPDAERAARTERLTADLDPYWGGDTHLTTVWPATHYVLRTGR